MIDIECLFAIMLKLFPVHYMFEVESPFVVLVMLCGYKYKKERGDWYMSYVICNFRCQRTKVF